MGDCLTNIEAILLSYRPPDSIITASSVHRTPFVATSWQWHGLGETAPATVISFNDSNDEILCAALWPDRGGTTIGLFPLGVGDERLLALPIIGHLKQRDPSLTSIGVIPSDQIILMPPRVPDLFVEEILKTAGFPSTPFNVEAVGTTIGQMFLAKAHQLIATKDPRAANHFVQSHVYAGGPIREFCQGLLDALATWDPVVLLYIQDLPMRVRALSLEVIDKSGSIGGRELER